MSSRWYDDPERDLVAQIHRFPENYPLSWGGLMPDEKYFAQFEGHKCDKPEETGHVPFVPLVLAERGRDFADEAFGGDDTNEEDDPDGHLSVHALDDGEDTFDPDL